MREANSGSTDSVIQDIRQRLQQEVKAQSEQIERLEQAARELREQNGRLESSFSEQLSALAQAQAAGAAGGASADAALEKLLGSVRNLITATLPEQVLDTLTEEAVQFGVRAAVFDVRGKSAWGASARGFDASLTKNVLRALIVPLNQDNPFRQVYETGGHVDASVDLLKKNRNILDKFKPPANAAIILLPVRSAGSVSSIFYADPGADSNTLPMNALKILAEFAGAQLDRLMALSGVVSSEGAGVAVEVPTVSAEPEPEPVAQAAAAAEAPLEPAPPPPPAPAPAPVAAPGEFDLASLSEEDQKLHKDAKRFAKLLVSEIELYNKGKVADGRKNRDIYARLKSDIERSRQTYEKRFGKTAAKEHDHFHDELVRVLATNDASLLGSDYPGPSA